MDWGFPDGVIVTSFEHKLKTQMISVVAPFGPEWLDFLLADPVQAHAAGQETDQRIENMVSFGSNGEVPNTKLEPDVGPAPPPAGN